MDHMFMCPDAHGAMWMWIDKRKGRRGDNYCLTGDQCPL